MALVFTSLVLAAAIAVAAASLDATKLMAQAVSLMERGQDGAEALARQAAALRPDDATLQVSLGEVLFGLDRLKDAESVFAPVVDSLPDSFDAWYGLGLTRATMSDAKRAEEALRRAVGLRPDNGEAQLSLGITLANLDRGREAERHLIQALLLDQAEAALKKLPLLWSRMGWALGASRDAALHHETSLLAGASWAPSLDLVRNREADVAWQDSRIWDCANSSVIGSHHSCGYPTVYLEAWQAAWGLVQRFSKHSQGKHVVIGSGLGAMCHFVLHLAGAKSCTGLESSCLVAKEAEVLSGTGGASLAFRCGSPASAVGMDALREADVVWVIDGHTPEAMQADLETHLGMILNEDAVVALFRSPLFGSPHLRSVTNAVVTLGCAEPANPAEGQPCAQRRPVVSWPQTRKVSTFVLHKQSQLHGGGGGRCEDSSHPLCKSIREGDSMQENLLHHFGHYDNQANMLEDSLRVNAYRDAMLDNTGILIGAVCVDVGAGMGILSFLAAQAGADTVYAVEPSDAAHILQTLVAAPQNKLLGDHIKVVRGYVADVPSFVSADAIVSEPFAMLLFSEFPILSAYLEARDRFLKPGGLMFPETGRLALAPFSSDEVRHHLVKRAPFWQQSSFYGIDLTPAWESAVQSELWKPILTTVPPRALVAPAFETIFDFRTLAVDEVRNLSVPFSFPVHDAVKVHGLAGWFDLGFPGGTVLSTSPTSPRTHWQQCVLPLKYPLHVDAEQILFGELHFEVRTTMKVNFRMCVDATGTCEESALMDLHRQQTRIAMQL